MELLIQRWLEVPRLDIFVFFLILENIQAFNIKDAVSCGFCNIIDQFEEFLF